MQLLTDEASDQLSHCVSAIISDLLRVVVILAGVARAYSPFAWLLQALPVVVAGVVVSEMAAASSAVAAALMYEQDRGAITKWMRRRDE